MERRVPLPTKLPAPSPALVPEKLGGRVVAPSLARDLRQGATYRDHDRESFYALLVSVWRESAAYSTNGVFLKQTVR